MVYWRRAAPRKRPGSLNYDLKPLFEILEILDQLVTYYRVLLPFYRDLLTKVKIKACQNHYSELAVRYGNNKSKIWRLINDISKRKRRHEVLSR